jgi:hypothetical protein
VTHSSPARHAVRAHPRVRVTDDGPRFLIAEVRHGPSLLRTLRARVSVLLSAASMGRGLRFGRFEPKLASHLRPQTRVHRAACNGRNCAACRPGPPFGTNIGEWTSAPKGFVKVLQGNGSPIHPMSLPVSSEDQYESLPCMSAVKVAT